MKYVLSFFALLLFCSALPASPTGPDLEFQERVGKYLLDNQVAEYRCLFENFGQKTKIASWGAPIPMPTQEQIDAVTNLYVLDLPIAYVTWTNGVAVEATDAQAQATKPQYLKDHENLIMANLNAQAALVGYIGDVKDKDALKAKTKEKKGEHKQSSKIKEVVDIVDLEAELNDLLIDLEKLVYKWKKQEAKCWYDAEEAFDYISEH